MYFIETGEGILGKTIAFIQCAQFADAIVLATTDGGIMVLEQDDDREVQVYKSHQIQRHIFEDSSNKWVVGELKRLGVIQENEYQELCEVRRLRIEEADKKQRERCEIAERKKYFELKAKYEPSLDG